MCASAGGRGLELGRARLPGPVCKPLTTADSACRVRGRCLEVRLSRPLDIGGILGRQRIGFESRSAVDLLGWPTRQKSRLSRMTMSEFVTALKLHAAGAKLMRGPKKAARPATVRLSDAGVRRLAPYAVTITCNIRPLVMGDPAEKPRRDWPPWRILNASLALGSADRDQFWAQVADELRGKEIGDGAPLVLRSVLFRLRVLRDTLGLLIGLVQ
jgi:hypothetical protein